MEGVKHMDSRSQASTASGLNILAGLWLIVAPFVLGYGAMAPRWNDIVLGIVIGVFALIRTFTPLRAQWLSWANIILGLWLIVAPFALNYTGQASLWNDIVLGIVVIALSAWSYGATTATLTQRTAHI